MRKTKENIQSSIVSDAHRHTDRQTNKDYHQETAIKTKENEIVH